MSFAASTMGLAMASQRARAVGEHAHRYGHGLADSRIISARNGPSFSTATSTSAPLKAENCAPACA